MKRKSLKLIKTLILLGFFQIVFGQTMKFETLQYKSIFEYSPVLTISQDLQGRLWFGADKNLFIYDSHKIVNLFDKDSLLRKEVDYVAQLTINSLNHLFIASTNGVFIYDITRKQLKSDRDKVFKIDISPNKILSFGNSVFICSDKGLFRAVPSGESYILEKILERPNIYDVIHLEKEKFVLASENGIEIMSLDEKQRVKLTDLNMPMAIKGRDIIKSICVAGNEIWIGTKKNGVFRYNFTYKSWKNYNSSNSNLLHNEIWKIIKNKDGKIWIGTVNGLSIYKNANFFENYQSNTFQNDNINANTICELYQDKQNIIWIGTFHGGLNYVIPEQFEPNVYSTSSPLNKRLNSNILGSIQKINNDLWIATESRGINILDVNSGNIRTDKTLSSILHLNSLFHHKDKVYIGKEDYGYSIYDLKTKTVQNYSLHKNLLSYMNIVHDIMVSTNGTIYLGTKAGPYQINNGKSPSRIAEVENSPWVDFEQDSEGKIYAKRLYGHLYIKKSDKKPFEPLYGSRELPIMDYHIDKKNNVWLTTEKTIVKIASDGSKTIIVEFEDIKLWNIALLENSLYITCNKGLMIYNLLTKQTNILNKQDGLPVNNLSASLIKVIDKNIFVTSPLGLIQIDPARISINSAPSPYIQDIIVNESKSVLAGLTKYNDSQKYSIKLKYNENSVTFSVGSTNLIKPAKNKYRYILKGIDKKWKEDDRPDFSYLNISPGDYEFVIYTCNNSGLWSTTPLTITVKVTPPLWLTWWAYLVYFFILVFIFYQIYNYNLKRKLAINQDRVQKNKIKFFTHISHEIRTPLTLINAPLDDIIEDSVNDEILHRKLKRIKKNSNKLLNIINELLDLKKFEENKYPLKKSNVYFKEFLEDNFYIFSDLAKLKNINYFIRRLDDVGKIAIDVNQFEKVLFNLLSNAIKYTPENGTIYMELLDENDTIQIRIVDNGIGIKPEYESRIFEEYFQINPRGDELGTGIGLALSKEIVKKHEGEINCKSIVEDGEPKTLFVITIKKDLNEFEFYPTAPLQTYKREESTKNTTPLSDPNYRILIVEDNKEIQEILIELFKDECFLLTANDGEEGYSLASKYLPDLIISDIMMPKMNGVQLCEKLKSGQATSHIPIILLTAVMDSQQLLEGMMYGANVYLIKPIDKLLLKLTVNNLLQVSDKNRKEFDIEANQVDNEIDKKFFETLNSLIEKNILKEKFDVNDISLEMGMSLSTLYRKLKAVTDLTVNNYVKIYRLKKAKKLLESKLNISEVAYMVGFTDRKYFSKEFKKHFGYNPSDYKS
ncbi:MAG: response regulator [Sphingobacterium sp.]